MRLIKKSNKNMKLIEGLLVSYCHTILFKKKTKLFYFLFFKKIIQKQHYFKINLTNSQLKT